MLRILKSKEINCFVSIDPVLFSKLWKPILKVTFLCDYKVLYLFLVFIYYFFFGCLVKKERQKKINSKIDNILYIIFNLYD